MSAVRAAAGALLRSRDRATSVLTVAAFALPHAFLLAVTGGVMAFGARAAVAAASATADDPSSLDGMASFYVMLAYFAATLLIVPIISMGAAAARLGMSRRERDLAVLRLVGLAPGKTKLACILETCVFAVVGVVVGSILYAVTLPVWGALSFQGRPMGVGEMWVGVLVLLAEAVAMILLAALSSWLAMRKVAITPLGVARRTQAVRVSVVGPVLGLVLLVLWLSVGTLAMNLGTAIGMAVFMGFMGAIFLLVNLVGVWSISLMGRIMARVSRSPQMMVAGRRMADDPRAVWRSFGAVALVGFLVGIMYPASDAISMSGDRTDEIALIVVGDINRGMLLTFAITLALGAVSTAVNQSIRVLDFADQVLAAAVASGAETAEALAEADVDGTTVKDLTDSMQAVIGEKIVVRRVGRLAAPKVDLYLHRTSPDLPAQVAVLIGTDAAGAGVAHDIAMHTAAYSPLYLSREDVPAETIAKERSIAEETTRAEGKPEKAIPKIVEGRLNGFFKENCLVDQPYAKDPKTTVGKVVKAAGGTITGFLRFRVGA